MNTNTSNQRIRPKAARDTATTTIGDETSPPFYNIPFQAWLAIGMFIVVLPLLPRGVLVSSSVQLIFSLSVYAAGVAFAFLSPVKALPFLIGVQPLFGLLYFSASLYGAGTSLFYLLIQIILLVRLPSREAAYDRDIQVKGVVFLILLIIEMFVWLVVSSDYRKGFEVVSNTMNFTILLYVLLHRIDRESALRLVATYFTVTTLCILWLLLAPSSNRPLEGSRLGMELGLNPKDVSLFAVQWVFSGLVWARLTRRTVGLSGVVVFLTLVFTILITGSRWAIPTLALFPLAAGRIARVSRRSFVLMGLTLFIALSAFLALRGDVGRYLDQAESFFGESALSRRGGIQLGIRERLNEVSRNVADQHPFFGVGPRMYQKYSYAAGLRTQSADRGLVSHNSIWGTAAEYGYVGLSLFILWNIWFLFTRRRGHLLSAIVIFLSLVINMFGYVHGIYLHMGIGVTILVGLLGERDGDLHRDEPAAPDMHSQHLPAASTDAPVAQTATPARQPPPSPFVPGKALPPGALK